MKYFRSISTGCLVYLVAGTIAWAQSDSARDGLGKSDTLDQSSKPSDQGNTKSGQTTKAPGKDVKPKSTKSTGKTSAAGVGKSEGSRGDVAGTPDSSKNTDGSGAGIGKAAEANWSVEEIHLAPYATANYAKDAVTIEPTQGQVLIQASFQIEALRSDVKAVERYVRTLNANDRKELTSRAKSDARVLESKNIALRGRDGKRFSALWILGEGIRISQAHYDISPNRQSSRLSTSGVFSPTGHWLDAEQTFITRVSRPFNQPPITDYATFFHGILRTEHAFPVRFLFSVPTSLELQSLVLVVDSDVFAIEE